MGPSKNKGNNEDYTASILSTLAGSSSGKPSMAIKELRKLVFLSLQCDDDDKASKKKFKKAVQSLEGNNQVKLDEDGTVTSLVKKDKKKKKKKKDKKEEAEEDGEVKKDKKKKREKKDDDDDDVKASKKRKMDTSSREQERNEEHDEEEEEEEEEEATTNEATTTNNETIIPQNDPNKNKKCKGNPSGITRLFLGNLPFSVDEDSLETFLQPAALTHIKWITDKETGKFYGSAFVEMRNSKDAAIVVVDKNGTNLMDRPIKANYAPSRPGDVWPPKSKVWTAGKQRSAGGSGVKAMSPKPEGCTKLFIGNLSYDIDDEGITKFFGNVDAEIKAVRWISHKDTGDFKGVGFVEFWNTEACEKAATLNGKTLLGRPIRIDWDASNVN